MKVLKNVSKENAKKIKEALKKYSDKKVEEKEVAESSKGKAR